MKFIQTMNYLYTRVRYDTQLRDLEGLAMKIEKMIEEHNHPEVNIESLLYGHEDKNRMDP